MRKMGLTSLAALVMVAGMMVRPAFATNYAVLAGVNHYQWSRDHHPIDLQGAVNDVYVMREVLLRSGYGSQNVKILVDEQATRGAILEALATAVRRAIPGDQVLFYFSGHGTSGWDKGNPEMAVAIGPDSGGLAPYDLELRPEGMPRTLVIGKRDLRPILAKLSPKATGIVILDACYSENSSKSIGAEGIPKYIDLTDYLNRGLKVDEGGKAQRPKEGGAQRSGTGSAQRAEAANSGAVSVAYPYSNVISFAAASRDETAADIGKEAIAHGIRTVDNSPHGAFTNSLLKAMLVGSVGRGKNGASLNAIFRYAREDMRSEFRQTPQLLQPSGRDLAQETGFGAALSSQSEAPQAPPQQQQQTQPPPHDAGPTPPPEPPPPLTRVRFSGVPDALVTRLLSIPGVTVGDAGSDLILRYDAPGFELYDGSGSFLRKYATDEINALVDRVARNTGISELLESKNWPHEFEIGVDVASPEQQGSFYKGQQLSVVGGARKTCFPLAFDIDPDGQITMLTSAADGPLTSGSVHEMYKGLVGPPFGTDSLVLFGFSEKPENYERWVCRLTVTGKGTCPQFLVGSKQYVDFIEFLKGQKTAASHAVLRVATLEFAPQMN